MRAALRIVRDDEHPSPAVAQPHAQRFFPEFAPWVIVNGEVPSPRCRQVWRLARFRWVGPTTQEEAEDTQPLAAAWNLSLLEYKATEHTWEVPGERIDCERPRTLVGRRLTLKARRETSYQVGLLRKLGAYDRLPKLWADCEKGTAPCPFTRCRHHLALDVNEENGAVKINFPKVVDGKVVGVDFDVMEETCSLRVADKADSRRAGPEDRGKPVMTCEEVGRMLNVVGEAVRRVEERALAKLESSRLAQEVGPDADWAEHRRR